MNRKMMLGDPPAIRVARNDFGRLEGLLACMPDTSPSFAFLRREIGSATIAAESDPAPFLELGARVSSEDEPCEPRTGTVCLPADLAGHPDPISVLTPVGAAHLGLADGRSISSEAPDGRTRTLAVLRIFPDT